MRFRGTLLLLAALAFPAPASETIPSENATRVLADRMLDAATGQGLASAIDVVKPHWPLDPAELDGLKSQYAPMWTMVLGRFGRPLGHELVRTEVIGTRFVRYVYLQRFEKHAVRWKVGFYNPGTGWVFNSFKFDDEIEDLYTAR
ncbi:MAG: hypothetical protein ACOY37_00170 [Pseudomonadota bacterium]